VNYTFTDQEDDDDLGLYNYGARLYDPVLGRFISPDSIVQSPGDPQTLNRYTYCLNNPLIYTDPEGNFFIVATIIGAVVGGVSAAIQGGSFGDILKGIAIGAVSGTVGGIVGTPVASMAYGLGAGTVGAAAIGGAAGGMAGSATSAALTGGNIRQSMLIGGISGGIGGALGMAMINSDNWTRGIVQVGSGALIGGTAAEMTGGRFYEGAMMGAVSGAVGFGTAELTGRYLPAIKALEARIIEMLGGEAKTLKEESLDRKFTEPVRFGGLKGRDPYNVVSALYEGTKGDFSANIQLMRSIDVGNQALRFGPLHVRLELSPDTGNWFTSFHFDNFDIVTSPIQHGAEYLYQRFVHGIQ
jgi:RHS repeat-associated protein